jgi:hypothetical protein
MAKLSFRFQPVRLQSAATWENLVALFIETWRQDGVDVHQHE